MILLILMLLLGSSQCEDSLKYPENTADISSINNLAYKPPIALDPKIRKALLNVLNRLEEQEKTDDIKSNQQKYDQRQLPDDVKWEYKANDTFKEYNYYEVVQNDRPLPTSVPGAKQDKELIVDEPGALFFQIPPQNQQEPLLEKDESLSLQETKNAPTPDLIISNLDNEIKNEQKISQVSNTTSKKSEITENDVEVFQAPLLTAFTLEQDERGLPKRIIPLGTAELSSILDNKINTDSQETRKAREQQITQNVDLAPLLQNEQKRFQFNLESQLQELQEQKRQLELEKQRFLVEQEKQRFLIEQENARRLKLAFELRQRENLYRSINQNEIPRQEVALQKSIPLEIYNKPVIIQPLPLPQYKPQFEFPDTVDKQLQNLFHRSGINQGKQEDLNIVSKVLALNYGDNDKPKISNDRLTNTPANFRNKRKPNNNSGAISN